jgi:hypothetical protein
VDEEGFIYEIYQTEVEMRNQLVDMTNKYYIYFIITSNLSQGHAKVIKKGFVTKGISWFWVTE